jgi:hypothetical protein
MGGLGRQPKTLYLQAFNALYTMNKETSDANRVAIARAIAMDSRCKIAYLIPHVPQSSEDASPFGWYTSGLHDAAEQIITVAALPADIREPHTDIPTMLVNRLAGTVWPLMTPVETTSLSQVLEILQTPFRVCLTSSEEVATIVDSLVSKSTWPMLHASTISGTGRVSAMHLDLAVISNYIRTVLNALSKDPNWTSFARRIRQELNRTPRRKAINHPLRKGLHNVVLPNECAMEAFGWKFQKEKRISHPIEINPDPQRYIIRICASADAISVEREKLLKNASIDIRDYRYVITAPSIFWGHYRNWKHRVQTAPESIRKDLKHAIKNLIHASSYFDNVPFVEIHGKQVPSHVYTLIAKDRAKDMRSYTATLATVAATTFAPIIRLEPKINSVRILADELARCVRAAARHHYVRKTSRIANRLSTEIRASIDQKFLDRIDGVELIDRIEGLKLITDAPLEFMKCDGLPIGLRYDCSRISPIPGNLFHQISTRMPLHLPLSAFDEVLVIRSFVPEDPLKRMLSGAIETLTNKSTLKRVKIRFVDVTSADEIVSELNSYTGSIVLFDCHGVYGKENGMGALMIGGKPLSFWDLKYQCKLPPIVMFSACDTQPIDGSHSSVATSAFALGAYAVLGTYLPISAIRAAVFNARMILRLDGYIPAALKSRKHVTWREVVSGMLRMSYVIEAMDLLVTYGGINLSRESMSSIQFDTTNHISARRPGWFGVLVDRIAAESECSKEYVKDVLDQWCSLTDAMKYVQLGSPERIIITDNLLDPEMPQDIGAEES